MQNKVDDCSLEKIADSLSEISFALRTLAGVGQTMGALEYIGNCLRDGLADIAEAIREFASVLAESNGGRAGKRPEPAAKAVVQLSEVFDQEGADERRQ